jgi:LmbE family N-acetylglucosaminyl deacetylase
MATLVAFHAHPDDECLLQSGSLAKAVDAGHRVVIVYATAGELGSVPDGLLGPGESLAARRVAEAEQSAAATGAHRLVWLGYHDSGMDGDDTNDHPASFWQADVDEAARRLLAVLEEESAEVLTIYDDHGNYGHPDHVQVHRVGARAAELAGTPHVLEVTLNRDHLRTMMRAALESRAVSPDAPEAQVDLDDPDFVLGSPDAVITTRVDVTAWLDRKRKAIEAHASQVVDTGFFLAMEADTFAVALGTEYFIRRGVPDGHRDDDVFAGFGTPAGTEAGP